jgi:hypothetical protein
MEICGISRENMVNILITLQIDAICVVVVSGTGAQIISLMDFEGYKYLRQDFLLDRNLALYASFNDVCEQFPITLKYYSAMAGKSIDLPCSHPMAFWDLIAVANLDNKFINLYSSGGRCHASQR